MAESWRGERRGECGGWTTLNVIPRPGGVNLVGTPTYPAGCRELGRAVLPRAFADAPGARQPVQVRQRLAQGVHQHGGRVLGVRVAPPRRLPGGARALRHQRGHRLGLRLRGARAAPASARPGRRWARRGRGARAAGPAPPAGPARPGSRPPGRRRCRFTPRVGVMRGSTASPATSTPSSGRKSDTCPAVCPGVHTQRHPGASASSPPSPASAASTGTNAGSGSASRRPCSTPAPAPPAPRPAAAAPRGTPPPPPGAPWACAMRSASSAPISSRAPEASRTRSTSPTWSRCMWVTRCAPTPPTTRRGADAPRPARPRPRRCWRRRPPAATLPGAEQVRVDEAGAEGERRGDAPDAGGEQDGARGRSVMGAARGLGTGRVSPRR